MNTTKSLMSHVVHILVIISSIFIKHLLYGKDSSKHLIFIIH